MNKHIFAMILLVCGFLSFGTMANTADSTVPDPFKRSDENSKLKIDYTDLDSLLEAVVLNTGRSTREKARHSQSKTGTRMQIKVNRATINEGNRFYFEIFEDNETNQQTLLDIRNRLESIPTAVPLEKFTRAEQLAYWINLYNVTLLEEIARIYPQPGLKKLLVGREEILSKKALFVGGIPLSLNDIQFTILKQNYDSNPLVIYGLFQGIIGGPSIRKQSYTGQYVYGDLIDNAMEFINSNRGTESKNAKVFRVSSLYERNRPYFTDFDADLKKHLLEYLEGDELGELQVAKTIKPDIDDWTIPDIFGYQRDLGGSLASNNAALMGAASGNDSSRFAAKGIETRGYNPETLKRLNELQKKQEEQRTGTVSIEEMGQAPEETDTKD